MSFLETILVQFAMVSALSFLLLIVFDARKKRNARNKDNVPPKGNSGSVKTDTIIMRANAYE